VLHRTPFSSCSLHQKQDLLAVGSIIQNLICLLSPDHETFYRLLLIKAPSAKISLIAPAIGLVTLKAGSIYFVRLSSIFDGLLLN
jgi:hypothetical protein